MPGNFVLDFIEPLARLLVVCGILLLGFRSFLAARLFVAGKPRLGFGRCLARRRLWGNSSMGFTLPLAPPFVYSIPSPFGFASPTRHFAPAP